MVSESHPREGGHRWFRLRREAEDIVPPLAPQSSTCPNTAKIERLLGPADRTPLADAVALTIEWLAARDT